MKFLSVGVGTASSLVLATTAAVVYFLAPPAADYPLRTATNAVQEIRLLGADWGVETARLQAASITDFDRLAAFIFRANQLKQDLSASVANVPDLPDQLAVDIDAYIETIDTMVDRLERFKSTYAVIRNSERFFPLASTDLVLQAEQAGYGDLAKEIADITVDMETFSTSPTDEARKRLGVRLQKLDEQKVDKEEPIPPSISNFVSHSRILLDKRQRFDELVTWITSSPLADQGDPLADFLEAEREDRRRQGTLRSQISVGLGAGALLILILVGVTRLSSATRRTPLAETNQPETHATEFDVYSYQEPTLTDSPDVEAQGGEARIAHGLVDHEDFARATRRDLEGMDGTEFPLTTQLLAGLMGKIMGACARRVTNDLKALRGNVANPQVPPEMRETAHQLDRLLVDARWLVFFARGMAELGKRVAPETQESVDVNQCLDEVLDQTEVEMTCSLKRHYNVVPGIRASRTDIRHVFKFSVDYVHRALQDIDGTVAELEIRTVPSNDNVAISFIFNGELLTHNQCVKRFIPFYGSQDGGADLTLPSVWYLANQYGGTTRLEGLPDKRMELSIRLPVHADIG